MSFPIPEKVLAEIEVLASDVDGTVTINGKIPGANLDYISKLRKAGIKVFLVTGRTAGHGLSITTYFDVDGAIGENGGVICLGETIKKVGYFNPETMEKVNKVFDRVKRVFPKARPTDENFMRLTDKTFHVDDFTLDDISRIEQMAKKEGLGILYSSVHLHICDPKINKGRTLVPFLNSFGVNDMKKVITIGDSPNDVGIFDTALFPNSVGVKNVENYLDRLLKKPRYILQKREGDGFASLCQALLDIRK